MFGSLAIVAVLQAAPLPLPGGAVPPFPDDPQFDNRIGSWFNFESDVRDFGYVFDADETWLIALNPPALRMEVVHIPTGASVFSLPAGPGLVTCEPRPGTFEVWMVDSVTSTVSVVDLFKFEIASSIRVGGEPHELLFSDDGGLAYVSCTASKDVVVIDAAARMEVDRIATGLDSPRGMAIQDGVLWVTSFFSGNGTTSVRLPDNYLPAPNKVETIIDTGTFPGINPLPDLDLVGFALNATGPAYVQAIDGAEAHGLGTVLFDAVARPGTAEVWVPNTEALNLTKGEVNFIEGQVVSNRVTIVDTSNLGNPTILDLDAMAPAGVRCSQPTSVVFDTERDQAYVFGYGSDIVAVLDTSASPPAWAGHYEVAANGLAAGPRVGFLGPGAKNLYVFGKADNAYTIIDLSVAPAAVVAPPPSHEFGYDPTPQEVEHGRGRFNDANLSRSRTSSCASCHIDGHLDKIVWNLGAFLDPEGTPPDQMVFERDRKGPMVTQSMRALGDSGPYHWRGERDELSDFNVTFAGLFEHPDQNGEPSELPPEEFAEIERYILSLVYPPNPRQELDRGFTPDQQAGHDLFTSEDIGGTVGCVVCHAMPIATNGEIQRQNPQFELSASIVVPQLRGIADKDSPAHVLGGGFKDTTEIGIGFTHDGASSSLLRFVQDTFGSLTATEQVQVHEFLRIFDTGMAPSVGYQATVNASNHSNFVADQLQVLLDAADASHCDVILVSRRLPLGGKLMRVQGAYDRGSGKFQLPWREIQQFPAQTFVDLAGQGWGATTFIGVPLGMGWRFGVDLDHDGLYDHDETAWHTTPTDPDTDGDGFPDGHEVDNGMNPLIPDLTSTDTTPPDLVDGKIPRLFKNTNTAKYSPVTSEPARIVVRAVGSPEILAESPAHEAWDVNHELIIGRLPDGATTNLQFEITDPAGNVTLVTKDAFTDDEAASLSTHVDDIDITIFASQVGLTLDATATIRVSLVDRDDAPLAAGVPLIGFLYHQVDDQPMTILHQFKPGFSDAAGVVTMTQGLPSYTLSSPGATPPPRRVFFGVREVYDSQGDGSGSEYVDGHDVQSFLAVQY